MNVFYRLIQKIIFICIALVSVHAIALTESGVVIKNQAGATYIDSADIQRSTTSNMVETIVQSVSGVSLIDSQSKRVAPDGVVTFNHLLTNVGNDTDTFKLSYAFASSAIIESVLIYPDVDNDGVKDAGSSPIASDTVLQAMAPDEVYSFILEVDMSNSASDGDVVTVDITAESQNNVVDGITVVSGGSSTATNQDTITVSLLPIINATKNMSEDLGASPSASPFTVSLVYENVGVSDMPVASDIAAVQANPTLSSHYNIILEDVLPAGMSFADDKVRWTIDGTEIEFVVNDGTSNLSVHGSYAGFFEYTNGGQGIKAQIIGLVSDKKAKIDFDVVIDSNVLAQTLFNQATLEYMSDPASPSDPMLEEQTNKVPYDVIAQYSVVANNGGCDGSGGNCNAEDDSAIDTVRVDSASQGERVSFTNFIWNHGNDEDIFNITIEAGNTFPAGTTFFLYKSDGVTPLLDTDNDDKPDTGPIPGKNDTCKSYQVEGSTAETGIKACGVKVVLVATLPASVTSGSDFQVVKKATSSSDTSKFNVVTDELGSIVGNTVDVTNDEPLKNSENPSSSCEDTSSNCGVGQGPEASPVRTVSVIPGNVAKFDLYVTNTSNVADSYTLSFSDAVTGADPNTFVASSLPTGWGVTFKDGADGSVITSIPVLGPQKSKHVIAEVSVPEDATSPLSIFFKVISPTSGATDMKHDRVGLTFDGSSCLSIDTGTEGRMFSGGHITYKHRITNLSYEEKTDISLTASNAPSGLASVMLFEDTNSNGELDENDVQIVAPIASLAAQADYIFFSRVQLNSGIAEGLKVSTTIEAQAACGNASLVDLTYVTDTIMNIIKEQALDSNCDGTEEGTFTLNTFDVQPNECIIYRLTSTNIGIKDAHNVRFKDEVPLYTKHRIIGSLPSISNGTPITISEGHQGDIIIDANSVATGKSVVLLFAVQVDD
ncbi:hypothetical protein L4D04_05540 [Photobacterium angustum]|uniref:DUF11 domain-containing protein n=1 Tax=Photobacterium angustum (strain S14 / CCUG 15956) TaxID=314292 RepID=Q1ZU69_PHOAS|nr:hypothetical protein [Photobacterium angustum]EAS66541.1 hypothetical protein VAS14_14529 [Photobacterium angustum S14]